MPYSIEWTKEGALAYYTGLLSADDIIRSESEITDSQQYRTLRYVIADFLNAQHPEMSERECQRVRALRLSGFYANPRIKLSFITDDSKVKRAIERSVIEGQTLHTTSVFSTFEAAMAWATAM